MKTYKAKAWCGRRGDDAMVRYRLYILKRQESESMVSEYSEEEEKYQKKVCTRRTPCLKSVRNLETNLISSQHSTMS